MADYELQENKSTNPMLIQHGKTRVTITHQDKISSEPKDIQRAKIKGVFDLEDAHADTAKWLSLITTVVSEMYGVMTTTSKNQLDPNVKAIIEYTFSEFKKTSTRADVQFAKEGTGMVDRLLERQAEVGKILS